MNLSTKELAYLQPLFPDRTAISLFSNIKATPDGTEYENLTKKGIIQGNGYQAEALEILKLIAKPQKCARLVIKNDFAVIEKYTYRSEGKLVLAENKNGEFAFNRPDNLTDVAIAISEYYGMSSIKTADVAVTLKAAEMLVLLAVIDIYRKNTLLVYAGKANGARFASVKEIADELEKGYENGLVQVLIKNYSYQKPAASELDQLLAHLVEKKCLLFAQGYQLSENLTLFAKNFLIPNSVVLYEAFQSMPNGDLLVDGGLCITAGVHDILALIIDDDKIKLSTINAAQMLMIIENILSCPAIGAEAEVQQQPAPKQPAPPIPGNVPPPPPLVSAPVNSAAAPVQPKPAAPVAEWQCSCGRVNKGNFCASCGKRRP